MEDFEIIEADFQQYYNLDVSEISFSRYARLLSQLPIESRYIQKYNSLKDWNWDKEIQSQILAKLDAVYCAFLNANRKKGKKPIKPQEQMMPEYVKKAKVDYLKRKQEAAILNEEEMAKMDAYWKRKNPNIKFLEVKNGD